MVPWKSFICRQAQGSTLALHPSADLLTLLCFKCNKK